MKSITYQSHSSIDTNTALNSKDILGYKSTVDDTTIHDRYHVRYLACKKTNRQTFSRTYGWLGRYLSLFCRIWLVLLMTSAMCSTLAQPHMLENHDRGQNDFLQYSSNSEHQHFNHTYHHHLNHTYHHHLPPQIQYHHNQSINFHHHRSKLQIPRYSTPNNTNHNQPITSKPYQGLKRPSSKSFYNSQGVNNPDKRHIFSPRESTSSVKLTDRKSKNPRRFSNHREERDRSLYDYNDDNDEVEDTGRPCVYSGHLKTESNWYGYLANISLAGGTGRLVFEFSYPAESCCLSVLFYYEDQLSIMSARTNCWQKEDLLRPDADQILRLTPSFSWSGCQIKKRQGGDMMVCKGGRSFTKHGYDFHHSTSSKDKTDVDEKANQRQRNSDVASNAAVWYVAVSRCASLRGLNLRYKLKVYGHSAPCNADYGNEDDISSDKESQWAAKKHKPSKNPNDSNKKDNDVIKTGLASSSSSSSSQSSSSASSSYQSHRPSDAAHTHLASDEWPVCTIEGSVNTTHSWFGFIKNLSLVDGGGFRFYFSLPYSMSPMNVLLYHDEDIRKLHWEQICWLKESVIESKHVLERIIDLTSRSIYNGCASKTGANIEGNNLTCRGEKIFSGDRNIYIALSNCRSREGLLLRYKLEVFGYKDQTMCSKGPGTYRKSLFLSLFVYSTLSLIMAAFR